MYLTWHSVANPVEKPLELLENHLLLWLVAGWANSKVTRSNSVFLCVGERCPHRYVMLTIRVALTTRFCLTIRFAGMVLDNFTCKHYFGRYCPVAWPDRSGCAQIAKPLTNAPSSIIQASFKRISKSQEWKWDACHQQPHRAVSQTSDVTVSSPSATKPGRFLSCLLPCPFQCMSRTQYLTVQNLWQQE